MPSHNLRMIRPRQGSLNLFHPLSLTVWPEHVQSFRNWVFFLCPPNSFFSCLFLTQLSLQLASWRVISGPDIPAAPCRVPTESASPSWNPNPHLPIPSLEHSAFGESSKIGLLSDPRRQELGDCSDGEYCSGGGYRRIYLAILCRIGLHPFIFGNRISPRTTLHFSDPYTHNNVTEANERWQSNSLQTTQNVIIYFHFCQNL